MIRATFFKDIELYNGVMQSMNKRRTFHVISNTHWDREWRFPFQVNRQMLVDMMDKLLEILETAPDYRAFHLDSQTIVLEDYLAIKPHKKSLIQRFVQDKRLIITTYFILYGVII